MSIKRVSMLVWLASLVAVLWSTHGCAHPIRNVAAVAPEPRTGGAALLAEVRAELAAMRTTRYQHTTAVNAAEGEYFYDCSGFLDYALQRSLPAHLAALPVSETKGRPLAQDFEHHFRESTDGGPWRRVATVADLRPGDVIAWLATPDSKTRDTGHVMVVLREPEHSPRRPDEWTVEIADSTSSPHARDSRGADEEGLGTGTVGLSVDGSGRPVGFYWRGGVSRSAKLTDVSLGRAW